MVSLFTKQNNRGLFVKDLTIYVMQVFRLFIFEHTAFVGRGGVIIFMDTPTSSKLHYFFRLTFFTVAALKYRCFRTYFFVTLLYLHL